MASTMPVCVKHRLPLAALLLSLALPAGADFKVAELQPRFEGQTLILNGRIDLELTPKVEEALSKGIQIEVLIDARLQRTRFVVWHQGVGRWSLRRRIWYHALSGQYLVGATDAGADARESFTSLAEALKALGALNDLRFTLDSAPEAGGNYSVELRATLDIESLPAPLRPVAYTTPSWHLNSGWSTWTFAP